MPSQEVEKALHVGVSAANAPHTLAVSTTEQLVAIPAAWKRRYVSFVAEDARVFVRFGDSSATVDPTARSTLDAGGNLVSPSPDATPHLRLWAGVEARVWIDPDWTHMAVEADAAGVLHMIVSNAEAD